MKCIRYFFSGITSAGSTFVESHPELKLLRALESVFSLPTLDAWSLDAKLLPLEEL
jgi:hypothetical protein